MLDPRAQTLLKTLVERYIVEGQPVGSRVLSKQPGLELSPATIRNVMADLEELGYIASPHTSAGRIPTSKGYRFFVDSLMVMKPLEQVEIHRLENEGDDIYHAAIAELFHDPPDALTVLKWKEVYEKLEAAVDRCENVANIIESVIIKHT